MKRGQLVRIVASKPARWQKGIDKYIGRIFPVLLVHREGGRETGEVTVVINHDKLVLNKNEYELVK